MAAKQVSNLTVGYTKLPGKTKEGSRASYAKIATISARNSMEGIVDNFRQIVATLKGATAEALEETINPTFEKSKRYCPKKTGQLVQSASLEVGVAVGDKAFCRISYGNGGEVFYAPIVHERTDLFHLPPTRSKWLQAAVEEDMSDLPTRFAAAVKKAAGGFK